MTTRVLCISKLDCSQMTTDSPGGEYEAYYPSGDRQWTYDLMPKVRHPYRNWSSRKFESLKIELDCTGSDGDPRI